MQDLELEHKLHEYKDLIGRDAEWIDENYTGGFTRIRGPILRIKCEINSQTNPSSNAWFLELAWVAITETDHYEYQKLETPPRWRFLGSVGPCNAEARNPFRTVELTLHEDNTLVRRRIRQEFDKTLQTNFIIHKPSDNLALENISP